MKINTTRGRLLASTMICGAMAAFATTAAAQDETGTGTTVQEIVVTGSRIPQPNLTSTSPLTVVNDQEIKLQGTTNVETLLQGLPSVVPEFNQGVDNGATGTATVALRGLGSNRTLVLIDGNRLMPGDPIVPTPDLNNIPAALVDRVEVITGGASAVYGSDAVAGVVNFIMKRDFEGVRVDAQYGFYQHTNDSRVGRLVDDFNSGVPTGLGQEIRYPKHVTDGDTVDVTVILGVNAPDDRGNVTAYASYRNLKPVNQLQRDFGACGISTVPSTSDVYDTQVCQGSGNSAYGNFVDFGDGLSNNPDGSREFVPYSGAYAFNFGPYNYYQQADERYTAGLFAHYEVNPMADVYSEFMFADDKQLTQAAPSGLFYNNGPIYQINCANPYMSAQQAGIICGPDAPAVVDGVSTGLSIAYRLAGHPRLTELDHTAYRMVLGSRGDLAEGWTYDAHLQYGKTNFRNVFTGDVSNRKINDALNAVDGPSGPVCVSGNAGCVPLDIFQSLNRGITPEMFAYISATGLKVGETTEQIATASITGDLGPQGIKSPWATDAVGVALGTEYRRETLNLSVDEEFSSADLSGNGGVNPPAKGDFEVYEIFGEARLPIVQDMPGIQRLSMELGYRWADYGSTGNVSAYKVSAEYAPTMDVRFRAGFNRAVRAPNIVELFVPQTVSLASYDDPCAGSSPSLSAAECAATGVTAGQYGDVPECGAAQCSELLGGNPSLKPEEADTTTIGFVATPTMISGLNFSLDYYDIKIKDPIVAGIGGALILSQCVASGQFCDLIHRAPGSGALFGITLADGYVINTNANSGSLETKGYDVAANYRMDVGSMGSLSLAMVGSYTDSYVTEPIKGLGKYDCAGFFGVVCFEPAPKWKHSLRATWTTPWNVVVSANWRHLNSVKLDLNTDDPFLAAYGDFTDSIDGKIPNYDYLDLSATWRIRDKLTLRGGVNNVFDKDPPILDANNVGVAGTSGFGNGNTFPGVYDTLGRNIFFGLTADF